MSISVSGITKLYGSQKALNDVSFEVNTSGIVGFLGPNGAGKSTMMKILTSYIPPSEGRASVCGFDVVEQSLDVRRSIGYLPEHNPLYLDMYVKEFLSFSAKLYGMVNVQKRVDEMIELTGLENEQGKKIGALSKGYRQRVGLAQAMIHDPKVLIMDEPTTGLDPNQLEEIRSLIRSLGNQKTVMLSTHIMQEVEAICDRVIIISKGVIVANDETKNLQMSAARQVITVEFDRHVPESSLLKVDGVAGVRFIKGYTWQLYGSMDRDLRKEIFDFAVAGGISVLTLGREEQSMQEVFRRFTG